MSAISGIYGPSTCKLHAQMVEKLKHRGRGSFYWQNSRGQVSLAGNTSAHSGLFLDQNTALALDGQILSDETDDYLDPIDIAKQFNLKGEAFIPDLRGSFALLLAGDDNAFLAARDDYGIKPLYWGRYGASLCFASEAKALSGLCHDIEPFPPGYCYSSGKLYRFRQSRRHSSLNVKDLDCQVITGEIRAILENAVVPGCHAGSQIGVFLSGGLDSSILAALSCKHSAEVHTFTVGIDQGQDQFYAREVARYLGTNHHEYIADIEEIYEILPTVIYHLESFDVSLVRSAVANYLASRQAAESGIQFILMGEGADELFGGYDYLKRKGQSEQAAELNKLLAEAHSMSLQRVDRMTAAYGLDVGLPFMDFRLIDLAGKIPIKYKIKGGDIEKWILRSAFRDDLPEDIVWRPKVEFSHGSGSADVLSTSIATKIGDNEFTEQRIVSEELILNSKEELYYYQIFHHYFPEQELVEVTGRWQPV
ncbi:asparagine synthase-related protein [Syntrophomonas erecta]